MPSLENLENELHVSKNVIKFLTQDLQAAQNEIRTLKVRRSNPSKNAVLTQLSKANKGITGVWSVWICLSSGTKEWN